MTRIVTARRTDSWIICVASRLLLLQLGLVLVWYRSKGVGGGLVGIGEGRVGVNFALSCCNFALTKHNLNIHCTTIP